MLGSQAASFQVTPSAEREAPRLTAAVFSIPVESGRFIVYAPIRGVAFVANARLINILAAIKDGGFVPSSTSDEDLLALLRDLEIVDGGPEPQPITRFVGTPEPTSLTLFLTTACSLRCTYCYASAGDTPVRSMPIAVAKRGIDFVLRNVAKRGVPSWEIAFHGGGEPSLNWATLTGAMDYARTRSSEHGISVVGAMASNGVLSDTRIDWVVANLSSASISFDGLPEIHDRQRPTAKGKGSSAATIHTLRRFEEVKFDYGLRVTVPAEAISRLPESIAFICSNFHPRAIQVEPAYNLGRWRDAPSAETASFIEAYREAQLRARGFGRQISFSAARLGSLSNHFCGVTQDSFCLSPNGNVSGCYEVFSEDVKYADVFFYGCPDDATGYAFDLERLAKLRRQSVEHRGFCASCFAKWTCGGDCYHKSLAASGGAEEFAGSDRCHIIRELTKDQLLESIAGSDGPIWLQGAVQTQARGQP